MKKITIIFLFCSFSACTVAKESVRQKRSWAKLSFSNGATLKVEIADTMEKRMKGLMHRTSLPDGEGMLFVFKREKPLSFWMRDTFLALSIAYFDRSRKLKNIVKMKPQNMLANEQHNETYPSKGPCLYALEVNQGWFARHKIKAGQTFNYRLIKK